MWVFYFVLFEIGLEFVVLVFIDISILVNFQFREVVIKGIRLIGRIGYFVNYVVYVYEVKGIYFGKNILCFVRKGEVFGFCGNIWDILGELKFFEKGVENVRDRVDVVICREMEL